MSICSACGIDKDYIDFQESIINQCLAVFGFAAKERLLLPEHTYKNSKAWLSMKLVWAYACVKAVHDISKMKPDIIFELMVDTIVADLDGKLGSENMEEMKKRLRKVIG